MTKKQKKVLYRIIASFVLLVIISIVCENVEVNRWVQLVLYLVPYLIIGYDILKKAFKGIMNKQVFDENFLMAVATIGAVCLGEYREGAAVMLFYQIGELFQSYAVGKSRKNISALMDIRPDYANIITDDGFEKVDPDEVEVGTMIIVNPGEKVPIDGIIIEGNTTLNTSALTGESVPREAKTGDEVISGCINLTGVIKVETTKEFDESTVAKILDLVENSSMKKAKTENFITRFAKYYTPAVCYGALALAILPPIVLAILGKDPMIAEWITRALTFLVISCPCALVISIPLSFFGGIGGASSNGILIKGSSYLEELAKTKTVVFDKTGTLTKGVFEVTDIKIASNGYDFSKEELKLSAKEILVKYAAYAESYSSHPISKSLKAAYGDDVIMDRIKDVEEIGGHGVSATVDGKRVSCGNEKLMKKLGVTYEIPDKVGTVVYVAIENEYAGYILISDVIKDNSKEAIAAIKGAGVAKTVMLTGDAARVADSVAKEIGIDVVKSELLPQDKVSEVEKLIEAKGKDEILAFVGDGINDAPVLARCDVGIAMGALGSDAAIEAADIVLMDDDPKKIALAMRISRKTLGIVKQNIVFAIGIKIVCLVLGALGIANMWIAIFADVGVMIIAVLNAMRALRIKK